jgi:hypothetical protein
MCKRIIGVAQELGRSCRFHSISRTESSGITKLQACKSRTQLARANRVQRVVPPNEGNEVTWDGRQEVIVS